MSLIMLPLSDSTMTPRSSGNLQRVSAAGAKFLTQSIDTSGPAGRMLMQMLGSFAEFEREMIRERTPRRPTRGACSAGTPHPLLARPLRRR